jgi:hypothetical protein
METLRKVRAALGGFGCYWYHLYALTSHAISILTEEYIQLNAAAVIVEAEAEVPALAEQTHDEPQLIEEDIEIIALAASLQVSDDDVRVEYAKWLMRYDKAADETRYPAFKKNILIQAQYNRDHRQTSSLNEYGDITEGTCRTWGVWLLLVSSMR